jgi:hypothetical protein
VLELSVKTIATGRHYRLTDVDKQRLDQISISETVSSGAKRTNLDVYEFQTVE